MTTESPDKEHQKPPEARREAGTDPPQGPQEEASLLTPDLRLRGLQNGENKRLLFKLLSPWCFVTAAPAD